MSAHVDPFDLERLKKLHDDKPAYGWLGGLYKNCWGVETGREVTTANSDGRRRAVCIPTPFGLPHSGAMVVRDTYRELWQYLRCEWLDPPPADKTDYRPSSSGATIVYSRSEWDKRHAVYFVLAAAAEARIPFVWHSTRFEFACVCIDAGAFFIPHDKVSLLDFTVPALLIIDASNRATPAPTVWAVPSAHIVVAAPHHDRTIMRFKALEKWARAEYFDLKELDPGREVGYIVNLADVVLGKTVSVLASTEPHEENVTVPLAGAPNDAPPPEGTSESTAAELQDV